MERNSILMVLLVVTLLQTCYCVTQYRSYIAYKDSNCTEATGGVTIQPTSAGCTPADCTAVAGMYIQTVCSPSDPIAADGLPTGVAVWYYYTSTDGTCSTASRPYLAARYGPPGACFVDESLSVYSLSPCNAGQMNVNYFGDYGPCAAGTALGSDTLTDGQCGTTFGPDQRAICPPGPPVAPPVDPPVNPPMDVPMSDPLAAPMFGPTSGPTAQPGSAPGNTPAKAPNVKFSGAVTVTVSSITISAIALFL